MLTHLLLFIIVVQLALLIVIARIAMYDLKRLLDGLPSGSLSSRSGFFDEARSTMNRFARFYERAFLPPDGPSVSGEPRS